jgi:D-alanyl-D-alanine carboxypeptidase
MLRYAAIHFSFALAIAMVPVLAFAAPYAALVMDARSGKILYQENADTRLHPASLTKMLTLYIAFEAIRNGEISLDTKVRISANAANEAPSKLGLKAGQTIALRYLIRAAAVKSANDCATAIGEAIGGSEAGFAKRMNRTAKALGMTQSTFKNANGLTSEGHLSTAHDMGILGRHLFYDFPEYYNIFSRRSTDAGLATVNNTNSRFLDSYRGADGIKTGYTGPAGFNLVASAERGGVRIIGVVFGGTSTAQRNAKMTDLLDLGFEKAPARAATQKPGAPAYADVEEPALVAAAEPAEGEEEMGGAGKTIRVSGIVTKSPRPRARPGDAAPDPVLMAAMQNDIQQALTDAQGPAPAPAVETAAATEATTAAEIVARADSAVIGPMPRPATEIAAADATAFEPAPAELALAEPAPQMVVPETLPFQLVSAAPAGSVAADGTMDLTAQARAPVAADIAAKIETPTGKPPRRPEMVMLASATPAETAVEEAPEVVSRLSTSDGRVWGITLGQFDSPAAAERVLMKTALAESGTLADALRKVVKRKTGFEANFAGMSQDQADLACRRLQARAIQCFTLGP